MRAYRRNADGTLQIIAITGTPEEPCDGAGYPLVPRWAVGNLAGHYPGFTPASAADFARHESGDDPDCEGPVVPAMAEMHGWPDSRCRIYETAGGVEVLVPEVFR